MSTYIAGFICALVLAALVVVWIAYCMFFKERHKFEVYHHNISDIQDKHYEISQEQEVSEKPVKGIAAGIFILPSRHKQKDDYEKRPDYPEGPVANMQAGNAQLIEILTESVVDDSAHGNTGFEIDSASAYHSDV